MKLFGLNPSSVGDSIRYLKGDPGPGPPLPPIGKDTAKDGVAIPDKTSPIIAWRVWAIGSDPEVPLVSVTRTEARWVPFERHAAICKCATGNVPRGSAHSCGIHASAKLTEAIPYFQRGTHVLGRVKLWGRVVVHDNNILRAQYAYPASFAYDPKGPVSDRFIAEGLARMYGVESEAITFESIRNPLYAQTQGWIGALQALQALQGMVPNPHRTSGNTYTFTNIAVPPPQSPPSTGFGTDIWTITTTWSEL